jgi:hypothetical protein
MIFAFILVLNSADQQLLEGVLQKCQLTSALTALIE